MMGVFWMREPRTLYGRQTEMSLDGAQDRRHRRDAAPCLTLPVCEHRLKRRVQFYETDMAGIVHFSCYFRYMEEAEHAMWREAGLSIHRRATPRSAGRASRRRSSTTARCASRTSSRSGSASSAIDERTIRYTCLLSRGETRIATGTLHDRLRQPARRTSRCAGPPSRPRSARASRWRRPGRRTRRAAA